MWLISYIMLARQISVSTYVMSVLAWDSVVICINALAKI